MKTTELAEDVVDFLNSFTGWSDLSVGTGQDDFIQAVPALDPVQAVDQQVSRVYVIPLMAEFSRDASQGRQQIVKLSKSPTLLILLQAPLTHPSEDGIDVATWDNSKQLLNLREEIDQAIALHAWPIRIKEINSEPAQDLPLKQRWFVSITEIQFETFTCSVT